MKTQTSRERLVQQLSESINATNAANTKTAINAAIAIFKLEPSEAAFMAGGAAIDAVMIYAGYKNEFTEENSLPFTLLENIETPEDIAKAFSAIDEIAALMSRSFDELKVEGLADCEVQRERVRFCVEHDENLRRTADPAPAAAEQEPVDSDD